MEETFLLNVRLFFYCEMFPSLVTMKMTYKYTKTQSKIRLKSQGEDSTTACPAVIYPHKSVSHSAPYWKCIIDHAATPDFIYFLKF